MEKINKHFIVFLIAVFIIICTVAMVTYFIGRAHNRANEGTGLQLGDAAELNRTITDEQRRNLDRVERSVDALERIRGITEETNSALAELGMVNRGSGNISATIREEAYLLADYLYSVSDITSDFFDNIGIE